MDISRRCAERLVLLAFCAALPASAVELAVRPDVTLNAVDERIYGFLLEHIYHSCDNGVWGEEVFNRSFEDRANYGGFYIAGKKKSGAFEAKVTGPDSVIGVRDGSRDGMRTNYLDWHVAEGYVEIAKGWRWYSPTAKVERIVASLRGEGLARIEFSGTNAVGFLDGKIAFRAACETGGEGLTLGGKDAPFGVAFPLWEHWTVEGDVKAAISSDAFNDKTCAKLTVGPKGGALVQRGTFASHKGDPVTGSYWLKREGERDWRKVEFTLPDDENPDAELCIELPEGTWLVDQVSAMSASSRAAGGFRTNLLAAVKALSPTILRWPGGSFVEHYDWRNGVGPQEKRVGVCRWEDYDPLAFGTDEFLAFCRAVGARPHIVLPMGYHNWRGWDPGDIDWTARALEWIDYIGDRCDIYEIDNETWKMPPELYVAEARKMAEAIRRVRPKATIIARGCGRLGKEGEGLDAAVREGLLGLVDFVSPHHYQEKAKFAADGVEEMRRYIVSRGMPVAFTEWNLDGQDMCTGLFAGGFLNMLERTPECPIAEAALMLRHTSAGGWDNAFINFDRRGWYYAPNAVVFKLWSESRLPRRIALDGAMGPLDCVACASADGRRLMVKVVNTQAEPVPLSLRLPQGFAINRVRSVFAPSLDAKNTMDSPDAVAIRELEFTAPSLIIPAFSATVVEACRGRPKSMVAY